MPQPLGYILTGVIVGLIMLVIGVVVGDSRRKKADANEIGSAEEQATHILNDAIKSAESKKREALVEAKEEIQRTRSENEREIKERRSELNKQERRLQQKEENLDRKTDAIEKKEEQLASRLSAAEAERQEIAQLKRSQVEILERISGYTSEEAKAAALAKAEELLAEYEAGDKTEESFAALAEQYSEDAGSNTNGGLYDSVRKGQMVKELNDFCFAGHKPGDTAIVYGESASYAGYHVMYYVGEGDNCAQAIARSDLRNQAVSQWLSELTAGYTATAGFGMRLVG